MALRTLQRQLREQRRDSLSGESRSSRHAEPPSFPSSGPCAEDPSRLATPLDQVRSSALRIEAHAPPRPMWRPGDPLPSEVARRLDAIRADHPRLHASLLDLDGAQLSAVLTDAHAALVRAPVGSGKTRVLVHRVLYLHQVCGVALAAMAVLTFTNRAAAEIRARVIAMSDPARPLRAADLRLTGTFHGVARALLSTGLPVERAGYRPGFTVLDDDATEERLERLIAEHRLRIRHRRSLRRRLRAHEGEREVASRDDLPRLASLYAAEKRADNAMDFDDLLRHATDLLAVQAADGGPPPPARAIVVDEMQDCEPRELLFLRRLGGEGASFFGVGDPHQAIYGWRGSGPEVFSRVERELGCRVHALPFNYRSTRTIVDGARAVLGLQPESGGELLSAREPGARIVLRRHHDPVSEALYLAERLVQLQEGGTAFGQMAVLVRLRAQAVTLRAAFDARGVPCLAADDPPADAVRLLTLHAAKGLEFSHVFLSGMNDGLVPLGRHRTPAEDAEERRLLFVGLTRARDEVEISYHAQPHQAGALGQPSPYLTWLPASLLDWHGASPVPLEPKHLPAPPAQAGAVEEAAGSAAQPGAAFRPGQAVHHPRYGAGSIVGVIDGVVECDFGKRGARSFPLAMCPLR